MEDTNRKLGNEIDSIHTVSIAVSVGYLTNPLTTCQYTDVMAFRSIPTKTHGMIDYLIAVILIALPWVCGVWSVNVSMAVLTLLLGGALLVYSIYTYYEVGVFKLMGMWTHVTLDAVIGMITMALPLFYGMVGLQLRLWVPYLAVGLVAVLLSIFSKTAPAGTITPGN